MDRETTRRAVLAALLGGGAAGVAATPARGYLDRFAPFAGSVWGTADSELPDRVESPYGAATLRYDDRGVPHVEADDERALYFAAGYAQGADRLFQMDLQRRQMRGQLSAVFGERALSSDRFHVKMDFTGAAEATWNRLEGSETAAVVRAFTEGVNRHLDRSLPQEFALVDYEPAPWTPADAMLAEKQISWALTGSFRALRKETVAAALDAEAAETLFPDRLNHAAAILSHDRVGGGSGGGGGSDGNGGTSDRDAGPLSPPDGSVARATHPDLEGWVSGFESPPGIGSNSWLVGGEHTASGAPILANDPHLTLMAPPVWYEQHLIGPETNVRGVTFPGVPFVVIGENEAGAWGFTNSGADVVDLYTYETRDGEYRYGDEFRAFETETRTVPVAGGRDREVTLRKTVHGPVLDADGGGDEFRTAVGVAWTGFGATRTTEAVRGMSRSGGREEFLAALEQFDLPPQNCVYVDRDGNTHYRVTGKVPIRRTDGDPVSGAGVFDGSAREGEWVGYTPYGETDWEGEGFIPFDEMPHEDDPDYIGTANQRIIDDADYPHYFAEAYSSPFRGLRLWERLDERVASEDPVTPGFMRDVQRDAYDKRAELFVPVMLEARSAVDDDAARDALDALDGWDYRMTRDSRAALVFSRFLPHYRDVVFRPRLEAALGDARDPADYYGNDWVLVRLPPDSRWFPDGRPAAIAEALSRTATELADADWETYGDYNQTTLDHPFDRDWLNYPRYPTDGSVASLNNFRRESNAGSSWRMISTMDKATATSQAAFPGGNDGSAFSDHYADQLEAWANGEYKQFSLSASGGVAVRFQGGSQ